jgi:FtsH-binding integral membrane protein
LIGFGIMAIINNSLLVRAAYASCIGLFLGIYLVFDTAIILETFQNKFSLDDAYYAALILYMDIIRMFLYILAAMGKK